MVEPEDVLQFWFGNAIEAPVKAGARVHRACLPYAEQHFELIARAAR